MTDIKEKLDAIERRFHSARLTDRFHLSADETAAWLAYTRELEARVAAPVGWKLVPVEPSEAMIEDGADAYHAASAAAVTERKARNDKYEADGNPRYAIERAFPVEFVPQLYRAMLSATPTPSAYVRLRLLRAGRAALTEGDQP